MVEATAAVGETERASGDGQWMIEADGLTKHYGHFAAVENVTFRVKRGEVVAFLGPNGAGKSTTMRLLTGYLAPTRGRARIGGFDVRLQRIEASRLIGYLPESGPLYSEMTPAAFLKYLGEARGVSPFDLPARLKFVREQCSLESVWYKPIGKLSKGFRQRVGMAQALLHDPDVLILDEPTAGLDPNQVQQVRALIRRLAARKTILLSTHILREVRAMCQRVILINEGRIVLDDAVDALGHDEETMEERFYELTRGVTT